MEKKMKKALDALDHWNYRIMAKPDDINGEIGYGLFEVFYDKKDKVLSWAHDSEIGYFESVDELLKSLDLMLKDAKKRKKEVLEYT